MMPYLDGFRDPRTADALTARLAIQGQAISARRAEPVIIMEVCGSHTMAIARHGIRQLLPPCVSLISGPGCPVCVTPPGYIDAAISLASAACHIFTFGDMLSVPGSSGTSLADSRAAGATVTVCYSPEDALLHAQAHPEQEVVFLAVGFESTIAPIMALLARPELPGNFSLLTALKAIPPALHALQQDPELRIDALLCPPHVSAIIGSEAFLPFAGPGGLPCVIAGFEPLDILWGIHGILDQIIKGRSEVDNQYARVVRPEGNPRARRIIDTYLQPCTTHWRGLGMVPASGYELRPAYSAFDAATRFALTIHHGTEPAGCGCGDVIKGKIPPHACPLFGTRCTPATPVGPCMVSSEGSCAAAVQYSGDTPT